MEGRKHFDVVGGNRVLDVHVGRSYIKTSLVQCAEDSDVYSKNKKSYWKVTHRGVIAWRESRRTIVK